MSEIERQRVLYSGDVQGVGFRYTARELARAAGVGGYVRNLADARVELVAEGTAEAIQGLLAALASEMAAYIADTIVEREVPTGERRFEIRF